jgi:hypothetical protein
MTVALFPGNLAIVTGHRYKTAIVGRAPPLASTKTILAAGGAPGLQFQS